MVNEPKRHQNICTINMIYIVMKLRKFHACTCTIYIYVLFTKV